MFNLRSLASLSFLSVLLSSTSTLAGKIEELGDYMLEGERRNAHIDRRIGVVPQQELFTYQKSVFVKGAVPGEGDCILLTLQDLFPDKHDISRRSFTDWLEQKKEDDKVNTELACELFYQLYHQHLQPEHKIEFKGNDIDKIKPQLNFENMDESVNLIRRHAGVLAEIRASLGDPRVMLSLSDNPHLWGTFGLACAAFGLNLDVFTQDNPNSDELTLRTRFLFGGPEGPLHCALFSAQGVHVSPLAHINDLKTRQVLADSIYNKMMYWWDKKGVYETVSMDTLEEAKDSWRALRAKEEEAQWAQEEQRAREEQAQREQRALEQQAAEEQARKAQWNNDPNEDEYDKFESQSEDDEEYSDDFLKKLQRTPYVAAMYSEEIRFPKKGKSLIVTTDYNANAHYQLRSQPEPVRENDTLTVHYRIYVAEGGRMALGFLNTAQNGWYGEECVLGPGLHEDVYESVVPAGETEASLIFRNYHLGEPGQSTFAIHGLDIQKESALNLKSTGIPLAFQEDEENGWITVTTDNNNWASYQIMSNPQFVEEDNILTFQYTINVQPGGRMALGFLNTKKEGWYGEELVLEGREQPYKGVYKRRVPAGETEATLIFRNYHLGESGQTTFTIKRADLWENEEFKLKATGLSQQVIKADDGTITVRTDNNKDASHQLRTDPHPVKGGDILQVPYNITVEPGGIIALGLLNTRGNNWYGEELTLKGREEPYKGVYKQRVPVGEKEATLVIRNYHLDSAGESTFTINDIDFVVKEDPHYYITYTEGEDELRDAFIKEVIINTVPSFFQEQEQLLASIDDPQERNRTNVALLFSKFDGPLKDLFAQEAKTNKEKIEAQIQALLANDLLLSTGKANPQGENSPEFKQFEEKMREKQHFLMTRLNEKIEQLKGVEKEKLLAMYGVNDGTPIEEVEHLIPHLNNLFEDISFQEALGRWQSLNRNQEFVPPPLDDEYKTLEEWINDAAPPPFNDED